MDARSTRILVLTRGERDAVELVNRALPAVGPGEALVEIRTAGICGTDLHIIGWNGWARSGYRPPVALGHEFCGEIVEIGDRVEGFRVGDRVVAETHLACGHCRQCRMNRRHTCENLTVFSRLGRGGFADLTIVPAALLRRVPDSVSDAIATLMEPLGVAVRAAMMADLRAASVFVTGSGPIGLMTVAAARALGARRIVVSDLSESRLSLARRMGATETHNPTDMESPARGFLPPDFDVAIDTSGSAAAIRSAMASVRSGGDLILAGMPEGDIALDLTRHVILREVALRGIYGRLIDETWLQAEALLARADFDLAPILTHAYRLEEFGEAIAAARSGNAGKVRFVMKEANGFAAAP